MAAQGIASGARAYAEALLDSAAARGGLESAREAGEALVALAAAWRADRRMRAYFLSSKVRRADKAAAIAALGQRLPAKVTAFVRLLDQKGRLDLLPAIADAAEALLDQRLGRVPVTISTAVPLAPEALARFAAQVTKATGKTAMARNVVKPELVAGAVVRIGDWLADGSARRHLVRLKQQIIERGSRSAGA